MLVITDLYYGNKSNVFLMHWSVLQTSQDYLKSETHKIFSYVAAQPAGVFHPHVLGILALAELVVLLPGIGFKVE